jgi:cytochrome c oxidase cbb3-type subunit I/II
MLEPESTSPGSIMPPYPWLFEDDYNTKYTAAKIKTLRMFNQPYPAGYEEKVDELLQKQSKEIAEALKAEGIKQENLEKKEIVALIAYMQRLGTDIKANPVTNN